MTNSALRVTFGWYLRLVALGAVLIAITLSLLVWWQLDRARVESERRLAAHTSHLAGQVGDIAKGISVSVDGMREQMQMHLRWGPDAPTQPLLERLAIDGKGGFSLDLLPNTIAPEDSGNCTGLGDPRTFSGPQRDLLAASLALNPWYRTVRQQYPSSAWSYVLGSSFIHIFPYRPSSAYHYRNDTALYQQEFWTLAQPEVNAQQTGFWTSIYVDGAGLGLMVTRSAPVYHDGRLVAVVAIDMTLDAINTLVTPPSDGGAMVVNRHGQVLALPGTVSSRDSVVQTLDGLALAADVDERRQAMSIAAGTPLRGERHTLIRCEVPGTDWAVLAWRPHRAVWVEAIAAALPFAVIMVLAIGVLLVAGVYQLRRRLVVPAHRLLSRIDDLAAGRPLPLQPATGDWDDWINRVECAFADRARLVDELQRLNGELEGKVAARTADLAASRDESHRHAASLEAALAERERLEAQLIERETLASLGQLVAGVAHEINSPLAVAIASADHLTLATRELDASIAAGGLRRSALEAFRISASKDCRLLAGNLGRAAELVRTFKQVAVDRLTGARRPIDLAIYLPEVMASLGSLLRRHQLEAICEFHGDLTCETAPGMWAQILTNLIENVGVHAYVAGGPVDIRCAREDGMLVLCVRDRGCGISPEIRPRVFNPFVTTRRNQGGTGLGLHLVHNLAVALGGSAECQEARPGTLVVVRVPAWIASTKSKDQPAGAPGSG